MESSPFFLLSAPRRPQQFDAMHRNRAGRAVRHRFDARCGPDHPCESAPIGATGARIVTTMANELAASDKETAVIGICAAGGLGAAAVLERV